MSVDSNHSSYDSSATKWQRARDACAGQSNVHERGQSYLPIVSKKWSSEEYEAYKLRATYFNATGRTVDGLVGMVFRKPIEIEQTGIDALIEDLDLKGNSLATIAQMIMREVLKVSRFGLLVEYPQIIERPATQAQAQAQNLRPYVSQYVTESIFNWEYERINNVMQPVFIRLHEMASEYVSEYEKVSIAQIRELRLSNGVYFQRLHRKDDKTGKWIQFGEDIIPLMNNKRLDFIPFYAFGSEANSLEVTDAPTLDLADLNLAHYRVTATYEHGCYLSGLATLVIAGLDQDAHESISVGGAIISSSPELKVSYAEVQGNFKALENNLERKEKQMAAIGARFLEAQKAGVESEGAMQMRANGESSVLAAMANLGSSQLSKMLSFMAQWAGVNSEVMIKLNTDYMPVGMSSQELTAIVQAWQANAISKETLFTNLKRGELIAENADFNDEEDKINSAAPVLAE